MRSDPVGVRDRRSEAAHVALLAGARVAAAGISGVTTLLLARSLSKAEYGRFALVTGVAGVLVVMADLGLTSSVARYLAEGRVDRGLLMRVIAVRGSLAGVAAIGLLTYSILLGRQPHDLTVMTRLACVLLLTNSTVALAHGLLPTLRRVRAWAFLMLFQPAAELAGVALAVRVGLGAPSAVFVLLVASSMSALIGLWVVSTHRPASAGTVGMSELVRYALPLFGVWGCVSAFGILDQALITVLKDASTAAPYALSWKLAAMIHIPAAVVAAVIAPRLVQAPGRARQTFTHWVELLAVVYVGIAVVTVALSSDLFRLIGAQYRNDSGVFRALSGYVVLLGIGPLVSVACNFLGGARQRVRLAALTISLNLGLDLLLIPAYGVYGAAIGTTIAYLLYVVGHLRLAGRLLGGDPHWSLRASVGRVAVAAALAAAVARLAVNGLSPLGWIGVGLSGALAFASYLMVTLPIVRVVWKWES